MDQKINQNIAERLEYFNRLQEQDEDEKLKKVEENNEDE
jgi:hypothetical protein